MGCNQTYLYQEEKSRIHILARFEDAFQGESQNTLKAGLSLEAGSGANPVAVRPFCAGYLVSGDQRQNISLFLNDNNFNVWPNKVAQISPRMLEISSQ